MLIKSFIKKHEFLYDTCLAIMYKIRFVRIKYGYINFIKNEFKKNLGYSLDLKKPETYNEKIQWLKCFYRDPIMTQCADKIAVRKFIKDIIGEQYLIPVYGIFNNVSDMDLNGLPKAFVLKPNHSSGRVIVCYDKNKMDWKTELSKLKRWLNENYYYQNGEWVYKCITPKIICEQLLYGEIIDYKFMCFNGIPKLMFTCTERKKKLKVTFFDLSFNRLNFIRKYPASDVRIEKPQNWDLMIELSRKLSSRFPFVRVDFYENLGKLYFGELTFFPGNGFEKFYPDHWDKKIGELLDLDKVNKKYVKV